MVSEAVSNLGKTASLIFVTLKANVNSVYYTVMRYSDVDYCQICV